MDFNKIVENEDLLKNIKGLFQNTSAMVREELFYCMGNFFSNSDVFLAKKLFAKALIVCCVSSSLL